MKGYIRFSMRLAVLFVLMLTGVSAVAEIEVHQFDTPETKARFLRLSDELRCPKCQNTNLSGSNAPIAKDLRTQLIRLLKEGKTDQEVQVYMVDRYGDFVLYRPIVKRSTWVLWFGPFILLLVGVFVGSRLIARRSDLKQDTGSEFGTDEGAEQGEPSHSSTLNSSERQRLNRLMDSNDTFGKDKP